MYYLIHLLINCIPSVYTNNLISQFISLYRSKYFHNFPSPTIRLLTLTEQSFGFLRSHWPSITRFPSLHSHISSLLLLRFNGILYKTSIQKSPMSFLSFLHFIQRESKNRTRWLTYHDGKLSSSDPVHLGFFQQILHSQIMPRIIFSGLPFIFPLISQTTDVLHVLSWTLF